MDFVEIIIIVASVGLVLFTVVFNIRRRKRGGCGGCCGCPHSGACGIKKKTDAAEDDKDN